MARTISLMRVSHRQKAPLTCTWGSAFQDGKLSSKAMFDKEELKKIQEDLPKYMNEHGFELERGELNSEAKHKTVAEFKQEMAGKEIEKQLVLEYGAPEYVNHQEEFVTKRRISKSL